MIILIRGRNLQCTWPWTFIKLTILTCTPTTFEFTFCTFANPTHCPQTILTQSRFTMDVHSQWMHLFISKNNLEHREPRTTTQFPHVYTYRHTYLHTYPNWSVDICLRTTKFVSVSVSLSAEEKFNAREKTTKNKKVVTSTSLSCSSGFCYGESLLCKET